MGVGEGSAAVHAIGAHSRTYARIHGSSFLSARHQWPIMKFYIVLATYHHRRARYLVAKQ